MKKSKFKGLTKLLSVLLCLCVLFSGAPVTAVALGEGSYDGTPVTPEKITAGNYANYSLTADNYAQYVGYYGIRTAAELYGFAELVSGGDRSANAKLAANITVNKSVIDGTGALVSDVSDLYSWTPPEDYVGTFDGKKNDTENYTISGLYVNTAEKNIVGLFGSVREGGKVQNLNIADSYFMGAFFVGGIVGYNSGTVLNCAFSGSVNGEQQVGGIVGKNCSGATVENCVNSASVSSTDISAGGIVGYNYGTVKGSKNTGAVNSAQYVGGIASTVSDSATVESCENSGTVTGTGDYTGGIVGRSEGVLKNNKNTKTATVKGAYYTGGVAGYAQIAEVLEGCTNEASVSGSVYVGGIVGQSYLTVKNCNNKGNVIGTADSVGGVVGYAYGDIVGCGNEGTVSSESYDVGGIAGSATSGINITDCYNKGDISSKSYEIGGIVGYAGGDISNCYNTGNVSSESYYVGGIVGFAKNVSKCYSTGTVTGKGESCGAVVGYSNGTVSDCYYIKGSATNGTTTQNGIGAYFVDRVVEDEEGVTTAKTADDFKSGEVAYLLNGSTSEGTEENPLVWKQTLTGDKPDESPNFTGETVYKYTDCNGKAAYANKETESGLHGAFVNGICPVCHKEYEAAELVDGVYEISNAGQLYWFAGLVNGTLSGVEQNIKANAKLTKNITVNPGTFDANGNYTAKDGESVLSWTPIGNSSSNAFEGVFDGKKSDTENYTISGLYFNDGNTDYVGLFGCVNDAEILNTNVTASYFKGKQYVGGITGRAKWSVTIKNCNNEGTVAGAEKVGGVAGAVESRTQVENCRNTGTVSDSGKFGKVGGIVGYNNNGTVVNCLNGGAVSGTTYVGGIVGSNDGTVTKCSNTNSVSASAGFVGGIVGYNDTSAGVITYCYNTGTVSSSDISVGGIVGTNTSESTVENCYNTGSVTKGRYYLGGIAGANSGTIRNCYYLKGCAVNGFNKTQNGIGEDSSPNPVLDVEGSTTAKTSGDFKSGEVCYLLNKGNSTSGAVFKQTLTGDKPDERPSFAGGIVYQKTNTGCTGAAAAYSNNENETFAGAHISYENGFCTVCGAYEEPTLKDGYYEIDNAGKLYWFATLVNGESEDIEGDLSANAKLTANITVNPGSFDKDGNYTAKNGETVREWKPIENYKGTFDGKKSDTENYTISGLYFTDVDKSYVGLFGMTQNASATVQNVSVINSFFKGKNNVGGVVGYNLGTVKHCTSDSFVVGVGDSVGGVVGCNYGKVLNCANTGAVKGDGYSVGGVVGNSNDNTTVENCSNSGNVSGSRMVGGVVGNSYNVIKNSYNTGNITGSDDSVGGVVGNNVGVIENCYNTGTVKGEDKYVGGIVGFDSGYDEDFTEEFVKNSIVNCFYLKGCATDGNGTVQNGLGAKNKGSVVSDTEGFAIAKTADDFKSGAVAYALNGNKGGGTFKQTLSGEKVDTEPNFTGGTVYKYTDCSGAAHYTNTETADGKHASFNENGFCTVCGAYEEPTLKDGYYEIDNAGKLYWFAALVNGTLSGITQNSKANAKLTKNITVNPGTFDTNGNYTAKNNETVREWTPIGNDSNKYAGDYRNKVVFDGNDCTISGLYFNDGNTDYVGLFGAVEYAILKNIKISNSYFKAGSYVGGIAGKSTGTVTNCNNEATIVNTANFAGGIVGNNYLGTITNSKNAGVIKCDGGSYVGGITGNNYGGVTEKCENVASVTGKYYVGGIVGSNGSGRTQNCRNVGAVSGATTVGGVAGANYKNGQIINCYNNNTVTGTGETSIGAVVGNNEADNNGDGTVTNCYYLKGCAKNSKNLEENGIGVKSAFGVGEDVEGQTTAKTADDFKSGAVAYALNENKGGGIFKQTLSGEKADTEPNFTGKSVYYGYSSCGENAEAEYTNNSSASEEKPVHEFVNGICNRTEGETHLDPATLNDNGTADDTSDDYYEIANLGQLLWFRDEVNGGKTGINGKLTENIDATSVTYIGIGKTASLAYSGTFDGNFKTLKIKLVSKEQYTAPFPYINGATIKNLTVEGDITTTHKFAAGIVGRVEGGTATLENCLSLVNIDSTNFTDGNKNDGTHGGIIAVTGGIATLNNCGFAGSMVGATTKYCGGIVGWAGSTVSISNSYVAATFNLDSANSGDTFSRNQGNVTLTNCYYLNKMSDEIMSGATKMSAEKFENGEVAYLLNGEKSTEDAAWKQTLTGENPDKFPVISGGTVYKMTNVGCTVADDRYSNTEGETFEGEHPTLVNGICAECGGYQKADLVNGVYEIGNLGQLMWFASKINSQEITSHSARLTADITIDNSVVWKAISLPDHCGSTFDGNNHTITFANTKEGSTFGLFASYNYSTIKNLYLAGSITCNQSGDTSALVNRAYSTTIQNVISTCSVNNSGSGNTGGLTGYFGGGSATIKNSAVYANVTGGGNTGGLIGNIWNGNQPCSVYNCAYMGTVTGKNNVGALVGYNGNNKNKRSPFKDVYYCETNGLGYLGGTYGGTITATRVESKTADDFEKGAVAYALNENKTEGVWKQTIGTDKYPNFTGEPVYRGYAKCDDTLRYSNAPLQEKAHYFDNDGFCCETEGETHYEPATLNNGVYEISKAGQLFWFANAVNSGMISNDANAVLTADIDLKGKEWTPIGQYSDTKPDSDSNVSYGGTFDGNYYTISNLKVSLDSTYETGLFSRTYGATLKNFGVINAEVENTQGVRSGVIAGELHNSIVENVFTAGTISVTTANKQGQAGGFAGEAAGSTLTSCFTTYYMFVSGNTTSAPTLTNCYYKSDSANGDSLGEFKSETSFSDGEVTYLLNGKTSEGDLVWKQTLTGENPDKLPGFTGETVYYGYLSCADDAKKLYTNKSEAKAEKPSHKYENGICCETSGETHYEPATLNNGVYEIGNAGQLYWFASKVNGGDWNINAKLTADITVNKEVLNEDGTLNEAKKDSFRVWTPIGNVNITYLGTFDGNGKKISGLYFNDGSTDYVGLFGYNSGTIKNVGIVGSYFKGYDNVGAVVGRNYGGTVTNCYNAGTVTGTHWFVGGVVGRNEWNNAIGTVTNCYNTGNVSSTKYYVGGVVGYNSGAVTNCYNTGNVNGTGQYVGGVVGGKDGGTVTNCYYLKGVATDKNGTAQNGIGAETAGEITADVEGSTTVKTAEEFASGEVAYLLNDSKSTEDSVWKQTLTGEKPDKLPSFTGKTVYKFTNCINKSSYLNEYIAVTHDFDDNGFCKLCDAYEPAELKDGVYEIGNAGQLYWFAGLVNGTLSGVEQNTKANAKLAANITVNKDVLNEDGTLNEAKKDSFRAWTPIGNSFTKAYVGTFDGKKSDTENYTVSGLYFNDENTDYVGLFGINRGTIKNVGVVGSYFAAKSYVGGVVGQNYSNSANVTNCYNTGTVSGIENLVGGIVGYNYDEAAVTNCYNTGNVSGSDYIGGVVGWNAGGTVTNCYNMGNVSGAYFVGGVVGVNNKVSVANCYNTGAVTATKQVVGGVVGQNRSSGTMTNCYNTGKVGGTRQVIGGVVGQNQNGTMENCYYLNTCGAGGTGTSKTADEFESGEVAFLLNGETAEDELVWKQTLTGKNADKSPVFTGETVYRYKNCADGYSYANTQKEDGTHGEYKNGFCPCGETYEAPVLNDNGTKDNTSDDYYEIANAGQLYWFASKVNGGNTRINGKLTANITVNTGVLNKDGVLNGDVSSFRVWTPIGNSSNEYRGTFDGKKSDTENYTVSGLYFNDESTDYVGLFGKSWGTVKNVGVVDSYFKGNKFVGGVVGWNDDRTVTNCYNTGTVSGTGNHVGGVVGYNYDEAAVTNCYNTGNVSGAGNYVGGVVGYNYDEAAVTNCYNTGNVSGTGWYVGGVVGDNGSGAVTNCYNTGNVSGTSRYVGGVVGCNSGAVTNCYNTGNVGGSDTYIGSVIGKNGNGTVTNCYYLKDSAKSKYDETVNGIGAFSDSTADAEGVTTVKTADQFASGEVAYLLQKANGSTLVWGQKSSKDGATPILTAEEEYRVIPVKSGDDVVNYSVLHKGDTNNDGEVTIADYQALVNIALSDSNTKAAATKYDLNGDGVFDVLDCALAERSGMNETDYKALINKALTSEPVYNARADMDSDGVVDVLDCATAERLLAGHRVQIAA